MVHEEPVVREVAAKWSMPEPLATEEEAMEAMEKMEKMGQVAKPKGYKPPLVQNVQKPLRLTDHRALHSKP